MNKLTAEKCREQIDNLNAEWEGDGLTDEESLYLQALEIALPILEQQERGDVWIEWGGGAMPTSTPFQEVGYLTRLGNKDKSSAGDLRWEHEGKGGDIIAYRIIPDQPTNQNGDQ